MQCGNRHRSMPVGMVIGDTVLKYVYSTDQGNTWSAPMQIDTSGSPFGTLHTNVFAWIAAGDDGRVAIAWYGTPGSARIPVQWSGLVRRELRLELVDDTVTQCSFGKSNLHLSGAGKRALYPSRQYPNTNWRTNGRSHVRRFPASSHGSTGRVAD